MSVRLPCPSCPWRVDQDASDIPNFSLELAEGLADTCEDMSIKQFACHQSRPEQEVVCAGWLARYGWDNLGVRLGLTSGRYTREMLEPGDDWPETHETFAEVIEKLRASADNEETP
jgi:hypothetical protein